MSSRRDFLKRTSILPFAFPVWLEAQSDPQCTLPAAGTPTQLVPNESTGLTRLPASAWADSSMQSQLAHLRDAFGAIMDLAADDPISWSHQIAQHCLNCAASGPSNIHYSWYFLPWHRAMLYLLERTLRALSGRADLTLPYWDWESSGSRSLPAIYAPANQRLYYANRNLTGAAWPLKDGDVDVQRLLVLGPQDFVGTANTAPVTFGDPHAIVHNSFYPGDMANLQYSPRDPVFYAHHCNIDRLWTSWVAAGGQSPDFGTARVNFYDEKRQWRYILLNNLRDESKLGYTYQTLMPAHTPLANVHLFSMAISGSDFSVRPTDAAKLHVKGHGAHYVVIRGVQNLEQLPPTTTRFGVFAGDPKVGSSTASNPNYLGSLSRVLSSGHMHAEPISGVVDVSGLLAPLLASHKNLLSLRVAALDALGSQTTSATIPLKASSISVVT
jgi:hypothetical protein